jgi:hypothetical protein
MELWLESRIYPTLDMALQNLIPSPCTPFFPEKKGVAFCAQKKFQKKKELRFCN